MLILLSQILTSLPASGYDEVENSLYNPPSVALGYAMVAKFPLPLSSFAAVVVMTAVWGRCASHLYTGSMPHPDGELDSSTHHDFWVRHHELDAIATNAFNACSQCTASQAIPTKDPQALYVSILYHTVIIFLHRAAVLYVKSCGLPYDFVTESTIRCQDAAMEIAALIRVNSGSEEMAGVRSPIGRPQKLNAECHCR